MIEIKNWYKYLWLLGFLGFLGLITDGLAYYGFFGFFGFIAFRFSKPAQVDLNRSARNSFIASIIIFGTFTPYATIVDIQELYISGYALNFATIIIVFIFSMMYYEKQ